MKRLTAVDLIDANRPFVLAIGEGVSDAEIQNAEDALGVRLPSSYRTFLQKYGWIHFAGIPIVGLVSREDSAREVAGLVEENLRLRAEKRLPKHLIWFSEDGADFQFMFDTNSQDGAEHRIIIWPLGFSEEEMQKRGGPEEFASDFDSFIRRILDEHLVVVEERRKDAAAAEISQPRPQVGFVERLRALGRKFRRE